MQALLPTLLLACALGAADTTTTITGTHGSATVTAQTEVERTAGGGQWIRSSDGTASGTEGRQAAWQKQSRGWWQRHDDGVETGSSTTRTSDRGTITTDGGAQAQRTEQGWSWTGQRTGTATAAGGATGSWTTDRAGEAQRNGQGGHDWTRSSTTRTDQGSATHTASGSTARTEAGSVRTAQGQTTTDRGTWSSDRVSETVRNGDGSATRTTTTTVTGPDGQTKTHTGGGTSRREGQGWSFQSRDGSRQRSGQTNRRR